MVIQGAKLGKLLGNELTINLPLHSIDKLKNFKLDDVVTVEIKRPKDKRTLQQNAYIWEIIGQIDAKVNGYMSDINSIYKNILQEAKIKCLYMQTTEKAKSILEQNFRVVEEVERRFTDKGESVLYRCYFGTSQFDKTEMSNFIETLINTAYEHGIDVYNYEDVLRGSNGRG